ncbi:MAG: N-acetylmuramoyl-L-alanine amidase [Ferruginibacter sp.]|nr:N-acetylmuramoyl-L-alanine amidase [Bacteroidota bacterium]MBX2917985.1 N-acetylmuramoyl-L-alanine amidase [Ferruginibacter sp.]MCC7378234.1 N-acetylmuramoyl-L-alanine amidase [Chitinophagaceae bacterium]
MKYLLTLPLILLLNSSAAQTAEKPFIKLVEPRKAQTETKTARNYIVGSTCKTCNLTINGQQVKVYPTGAFAYELDLKPGKSDINIIAFDAPGKSANKKLLYNYSLPLPPDTVKTLEIASIEMLPHGNLFVMPGDRIKFTVKALTGCTVIANGNIPLYEMPQNKMPGIYQGEYEVKENDSFLVSKIPFSITDKTGKTVTRNSNNWISMFGPLAPNIAVTKGRLSHLLFGLGTDRLGGAKIGYVDSAVQLNIIGKVDKLYKVKLSKTRTAYIDDDAVDFLPKGTFTPESLTNRWTVYGDSVYDYVQLGLSVKLPYQGFQIINPSRIVVDVFGATNNTNWITQLENVKEIKNVYYEQVEDGIFRITIELKHTQHWGYSIYYKGNILTIRVKHQPKDLSLNKLTIAVDAGHGGSNTGAGGPTGSSEKMITLAISLKLQKALEAQGAKVIMTRTTERFFDNKERILFYRDSTPDLLVSIHLNSSEDPITVTGTSTFYRYIGFKNLSHAIYKRMLELGLNDMGNNGSFNFMLNSPTEYPNALVETLFLSNPEDEMKILDEGFQQQVADKIVQGIQDFLNDCKNNEQ